MAEVVSSWDRGGKGRLRVPSGVVVGSVLSCDVVSIAMGSLLLL
jgi:hypothetical protein